jgi:hypothetical protein
MLSTLRIGSAEPLFGKPLMADGTRALMRADREWELRENQYSGNQPAAYSMRLL